MTQQPPIFAASQPSEEALGRAVSFIFLKRLALTQTPWFETEEEIRIAVRRSHRNARLLEWVRSQMRLRLSPVERRCIELYYFEDLNYRQAAEVLGVNVTSVYRGVRRAVRKLRTAAETHPPRPRLSRRVNPS